MTEQLAKVKKEIKFSHVKPKLYEHATPKRSSLAASKLVSLNSSFDRLSTISCPGSVSSPSQLGDGTPKFPCSNTVVLPASTRKLKAGQLPKYLVSRKAGWAAERAAKLEEEQMKRDGYFP
jgi:hypothetical protein